MSHINIREAIRPDGFIADYLHFCREYEYPESYAVMALLIMAACAVDKRILINPGAKPETYTNIYCILYGPSGARKSEALLDALHLLGEAMPDAPVFPMNFTMEALRGRMHKDSEEHNRSAGLIISEELSTLLGGRDYLLNNSLFLGKVWEGRPYETFLTIAHQEQIIRDSYVVLGGCSTPEAFGDLDPRGLSAGFLRRTLFCQEYDKRQDSALPSINTTFFNSVLVPRFKDRLGVQRFEAAVMRLSAEAKEINAEWYGKEKAALSRVHRGPRESHFINTMQVHAFKLGALVHLLEGGDPNILSAESLDSGIRIVKLLTPGIFTAYSALVPTPFAKLQSVTMRIAGACDGIADAELDEAVWKETGCTVEQAAAARLILIGQKHGGLSRKDGKVRIK